MPINSIITVLIQFWRLSMNHLYRMLLTSFNDSCIFGIVLLGSLAIVLRRLSKFSLPVVAVELPLLALNDEQIDALPKELCATLLNGSSTTLPLLDVDGPASNLKERNRKKWFHWGIAMFKFSWNTLFTGFPIRSIIRRDRLVRAAICWLRKLFIEIVRSRWQMILNYCLYRWWGWCYRCAVFCCFGIFFWMCCTRCITFGSLNITLSFA